MLPSRTMRVEAGAGVSIRPGEDALDGGIGPIAAGERAPSGRGVSAVRLATSPFAPRGGHDRGPVGVVVVVVVERQIPAIVGAGTPARRSWYGQDRR